MAKYRTISVKIPIDLKERAAKLGVDTTKVLRRALEEEVKRREIEEINAELERLKPVLDKLRCGRGRFHDQEGSERGCLGI